MLLPSMSQPALPATGGGGGQGTPDPAPQAAPARAGRMGASRCSSGHAIRRALLPRHMGQRPSRAPVQRPSPPRGTASSSRAKRGGTWASGPGRGQPPSQEPCCAGRGSAPTRAGTTQSGQDGTPAQHSPAQLGQEAMQPPSQLFLNPKPSPLLSFPYPLLHVLEAGLAAEAPPLLPRASQPSSLPGLGRRGPSAHPAPLEATEPGQRLQAGSGCPGCAVTCRAGKGCGNTRERTSRPLPPQAAAEQFGCS